MLKLIFIAYSSLLLALPLTAQSFLQQSFSVDYNHPDLKINCIEKAASAYIWIGTDHGLYFFDGIRCQKFELPVAMENITALHFDSNRQLWAGCKNGKIYCIKSGRAVSFLTEEGQIKKAIKCIESSGGQIWFGTAGEGLYVLHENRLYNFNTDDGMPDNYINCLLPYGAGMYAGTDRGVAQCLFENHKKKIRSDIAKSMLLDYMVTGLQYTENGELCVAYDKGGFSVLNKNQTQSTSTANWSYGRVNDILQLPDHSSKDFLISTNAAGIFFQSRNGIHALSEAANCTAMQTDGEGNAWLGLDNKLFCINYTIRIYTDSVPGRHCIFAAPDIVIYTDSVSNTLLIENLNRKTHLQLGNKLNSYSCIERIDTSHFLIGTYGSGTYLLSLNDPKLQAVVCHSENAPQNVLHIAAAQNTIYISSIEGVFSTKYANQSLSDIEPFLPGNHLLSNYIYQIYPQNASQLWMATDGSGVLLYANEKLQELTQQKKIPQSIYAITSDHNGNIYLSSYHNGLCVLSKNEVVNFNVTHGLLDDEIYGMSIDENNVLTLAGKTLLQRYDIADNQFYYYGRELGLSDLHTRLNSTRSYGNKTFVITQHGYLEITSSPSLSTTPTVELQQVRLNNQNVNYDSVHTYRFNENNFTFAFQGFCFTNPDRLHYYYQLENYNNQWLSTADKSVNYSKLPPGKYIFKVCACTNNNFVTAQQATYRFEIKKALWQYFFFWPICALVVTVIVIVIVRQQLKRQKNIEWLKAEKLHAEYESLKSQVNPHFLFNSLNTLISVIETAPAKAVDYTTQLAAFYRGLLEIRDHEYISVAQDADIVKRYFAIQQMRFGNGVQSQMELSACAHTNIPPLTLQMLAENALKHNSIAEDNPLQLSIWCDGKHIHVKNNLIAKKYAPNEGSGIGLRNISNRYKLLWNKEVLVVKTETHFIVSLPVISQ